MNLTKLYKEGWQRLKSMPDDPEGSVALGKATPQAQCMALIFAVPADQAMPYDNPQAVVDGIHRSLADDQALIEVGSTPQGNGCIYSIIKTARQQEGVQYFLRANIPASDPAVATEVQAFFSEDGTTGQREAAVWAMASQKGAVDPDTMKGWMADPYDESFDRPLLMNLSEMKEFDRFFPDHPLSQARAFAKML